MLVLLDDPDVGVVPLEATWGQRLLARLMAAPLDRALAAGVPPESSVLLAVRAEQLVMPPHRDALAGSLDLLLDWATGVSLPYGGRVPGNAPALRANARAIRDLAARLRAPAPLAARGVAEVRLLLRDGVGPLYHPSRGQELRPTLERLLEDTSPDRW